MKEGSADCEVLESNQATLANSSAPKKGARFIVIALLAVAISGCETPSHAPTISSLDESGSEHYERMIVRFASLRQEDPKDLNALIGSARYLRYAGRASEAVDVLEAEHDTFANHPQYLTELGAAYLVQRRTLEAKQTLERSLGFSPDSWRTHATLGIANDLLHAYEQAAAAYAQALESCPDSASIRNNLGISAASSGELDVAIAQLSRAHDLDPQNPIIRNNLELFREVRSSCPNCSVSKYEELVKTIHSQEQPVSGKAVTCSGDLTSAQEIVASLVDTSSIDMWVQFEFDSAMLGPEGEEALDELAEAMMSNEMRDDVFVIEGHTDAVGTHGYNQGLSERRAAAVRDYLMQAGGIGTSRLSTVGYGETRLLDPANPQSGLNRRVRVVRADS